MHHSQITSSTWHFSWEVRQPRFLGDPSLALISIGAPFSADGRNRIRQALRAVYKPETKGGIVSQLDYRPGVLDLAVHIRRGDAVIASRKVVADTEVIDGVREAIRRATTSAVPVRCKCRPRSGYANMV